MTRRSAPARIAAVVAPSRIALPSLKAPEPVVTPAGTAALCPEALPHPVQENAA